jgi:excinuclease ABC subunit A
MPRSNLKYISLKGVRTHNLKNINIDIPRDKLVIITGVSGSGKSSLAFDTLYAEGQRRYVESLSSYARQFLSIMDKPEVDYIEGLSPAISVEQKSISHNPRSTVGTITEIHDYLRLLFAQVGTPLCPEHGISLQAQSVSQMVDRILNLEAETKIMLLAPVVNATKGEHALLLDDLRKQGFIRVRINGVVTDLDDEIKLDKHKKHCIDVVIDRLKIKSDTRQRLAESIETALGLTGGLVTIAPLDTDSIETLTFSNRFACIECGYSISELSPRTFSFNSPIGACKTCDGLGREHVVDQHKVITQAHLSLTQGVIAGWEPRNPYLFNLITSLAKHYKFSLDTPFAELDVDIQDIILHGSDEEITFNYTTPDGSSYRKKRSFEGVLGNMQRRYRETSSPAARDYLAKYLTIQPCSSCDGQRLNQIARHVFVDNYSLPQLTDLPLDQVKTLLTELNISGNKQQIAAPILQEIAQRLTFLLNVGLDYLSLSRQADTLSGGETQRIRLASQIGAGLVGVMYVLDEPSIGLHARDNAKLIATLKQLTDMGNSVIVVEHDIETMEAAEHIIDIGPGAGIHGGQIIAQGTADDIKANKDSLTGQYLSNTKSIAVPKSRLAVDKVNWLVLTGASGNNLKNIDFKLPLGVMTCVTGVSGSGKSTLINHTLYPLCATKLNRATTLQAQQHNSISGLEHLLEVININQSPIGRTPRSNPATYTGMFTPIRELFANTQEARGRGYTPGRFSFNVKGGRCETCQGDGLIKVEMHFLSDIYVTCETCKGKRYNRETLEVKYKGKNITQILEMTVEAAHEFFKAIPVIQRKLDTLMQVGLAYITLGQNATTLSGGEAQRIKLAKELSRRSTGKTLYILDEPTTGLHFADVEQLLQVLYKLRDLGNSILVIEHNLDVIKTADWIVDIGPEGGDKGGKIIACGTPEEVAKSKISYTGKFLAPLLG